MVFTGCGWTVQLLLKDRVRVSYALRGARGNLEMESFISRLNTENRSLLPDAQMLANQKLVAKERMGCDNGKRRHSTIGPQAPAAYIATLSHGRGIKILMP